MTEADASRQNALKPGVEGEALLGNKAVEAVGRSAQSVTGMHLAVESQRDEKIAR